MTTVHTDNLLKMLRNHAPIIDGNIVEARTAFNDFYRSFQSDIPHNIHSKIFDNFNGYWIELNDSKDNDDVILFLHGGGFQIGSTADHLELITRLTQATGMKVFSIDYRLSPENKYPAALDDAEQAYEWLLQLTRGRIFIVGISVGATQALATLLRCKAKVLKQPTAVIAISPAPLLDNNNPELEINRDSDWLTPEYITGIANHYLEAQQDIQDPCVSPFYGDYQHCSPILLQCSDAEILHPNITAFYEKLRPQEVDVELDVWTGLMHNWHMFSNIIPDGQQAIDKIADYLMSYKS